MLSSQGRSVAKATRIFLTAWRMTVKRSLSRWRLLSTVVLGVLLASSVLAGAAIYFDALRELALGSALAVRSSEELAITAQATRGPTSQADYDTVSALLNQSVDERVGWLVTDRIIVGKSPTMYLAEPGAEDQLVTDARSYFAFLPRLFEQGHVTILPGGRLPKVTPMRMGMRTRMTRLFSVTDGSTPYVGAHTGGGETMFYLDDVICRPVEKVERSSRLVLGWVCTAGGNPGTGVPVHVDRR